jgi:hypothetical protein
MLNHFLNTARTAVNDINNYLKTNAEICLDFMIRLENQTGVFDEKKSDVNASYSRIMAIADNADVAWNETDPRFYLEENY